VGSPGQHFGWRLYAQTLQLAVNTEQLYHCGLEDKQRLSHERRASSLTFTLYDPQTGWAFTVPADVLRNKVFSA
jgi:hypothetical protein